MVRTIDLRQALFGLHYDLGEKLRTDHNPAGVMLWFNERVARLQADIAFQEKWNKDYMKHRREKERLEV